jgi:hypothetical protein
MVNRGGEWTVTAHSMAQSHVSEPVNGIGTIKAPICINAGDGVPHYLIFS